MEGPKRRAKRKPRAPKKPPARRGAPKLTAIGDILSDLMQTSPLGRQLEHARIWESWEEIVGPQLAEHGRPHSVQDLQLRIEVDSTVWMHRFSYKKFAIIRRINRMARKELISDVFFVLQEEDEED